jgi:integrase
MGKIKYPVLDKDFILKMLGACLTDEQRAVIFILWLTGMHISSLMNLSKDSLKKMGDKYYLEWVRPKTKKTLRAEISKEYVPLVEKFLSMKKKTRVHYWSIVKEIGKRAGYDDISPMTFRHTRCVRALMSIEDGGEGYSLFEVPHLMGTTPDVVARNYSQIPKEVLEKKMREVDERIRMVLGNGEKKDDGV